MAGRIEEKWHSYRRDVIPDGAPEVQLTECRRAFYAGAAGLMNLVVGGMSDEPEPTQADLDMMDELKAELDAFGRAVRSGEA